MEIGSESTTNVGEHAFANCVNLSIVKIPGNIQFSHRNAFEGCNNLTTLEIPNVKRKFARYLMEFAHNK